MTAYYVLGISMVVLAVVLSAIGLTREGFPPSQGVARAIMAGTLVLVLTGAIVLISTTHKEHPRLEAAAKAAEKKGEESGTAAAAKPGAPTEAAKSVGVTEKEFTLKLDGGGTLDKGIYTFDVANEGKIGHDLEVQGKGIEKKTPLIDPGQSARLPVDLKPGKYRFYCTVPGHAQSGMEADVTVR